MKKIIGFISIIAFFIYLIINPAATKTYVINGLEIWYLGVLPALLPFAILAEIILNSNASSLLESFLANAKIHLNAYEFIALLLGFLFGFPIGCKSATMLYSQGKINKQSAEIISIFSNQFSFGFIGGYLVFGALKSPKLLWLTYGIIYGFPFIICVIILTLQCSKGSTKNHKKPTSGFDINMQIIDAGIVNGCETLIKLCGYIVLFSICAGIIHQFKLPAILKIIATGLTEVTCGINAICNSNNTLFLKYSIAIFFASFGGLSGIAQTASFFQKTDLSIKKYAFSKLILSILQTSLAILFYLFFV